MSVYRIILILFLLPSISFSQDKGLTAKLQELGGPYADIGRQYAVFIAIDRYKYWVPLKNPVKDAKKIRTILQNLYYMDKTIELYDEAATKAGIIKLFSDLIQTTRPEDSVFIFYAGHGHLDTMSGTGFWIPVDGGTDSFTQENWLANNQIRGFIRNMNARHIALVSDSCFSGDILNPSRGMAPTISDEYFRKAYARVSRQVITSGSSESVPDVSSFAFQLKLALEGNRRPYIDMLMLYDQIRFGVYESTPLFGAFKDSGHQDGASFLFFLKDTAPQTGEAAATVLPSEKSVKVTIEKSYGTLKVGTKTHGNLSIDGTFQCEVPVGTVATIENVEPGTHTIAMRYFSGYIEEKVIEIRRDEQTSIEFLHEPYTLYTPQSTSPESSPKKSLLDGDTIPSQTGSVTGDTAVTPAEPTMQVQKPATTAQSESIIFEIPIVAIKVDGRTADWINIPPLIEDSTGDDLGYSSKSGTDIEKVFIGRDSKYFYMRFDLADGHPNSNLSSSRYVEYNLNLWQPAKNTEIRLQTRFDDNRWKSQLTKLDNDTGKLSVLGNGILRIRDNSFEARFLLSRIMNYIPSSQLLTVRANMGYDTNGTWTNPDWTDPVLVRFPLQ